MVAIACVNLAASAYSVPAAVIYKEIQSASVGVGVMHIPPAWLPTLARVGFSAQEIQSDDCRNVLAGAWVIAAQQTAPPAMQRPAEPGAPQAEAAAERAGVAPACVTAAADFYHLPRLLLTAILRTEGGHVGQVVSNSNGSYDMGPAQVNSSWLPRLENAGITKSMLLSNGCLNVAVGAWILAQSMSGASPADPAEFWRHIGNYNSHTPQYNLTYQQRVWEQVQQQDVR